MLTKVNPTVSSRTTIKSTPSIRSGLRGDKCFKASKMRTGRILAKRFNSLRMAKSPCSGRTGALSYLGPPIAAKRIASADLAASKVDLGSG